MYLEVAAALADELAGEIAKTRAPPFHELGVAPPEVMLRSARQDPSFGFELRSAPTWEVSWVVKEGPRVGVGVGLQRDRRSHCVVLRAWSPSDLQAFEETSRVLRKIPSDERDVAFGVPTPLANGAWGPPPVALDYRVRARPLRPGYSIGEVTALTGTLGAFAIDHDGGRRFLLSNAHVLGQRPTNVGGAEVLQPAALDLGTPADCVARSVFEFLETPGGDAFDTAIAEVAPDIPFDPTYSADVSPRLAGCLPGPPLSESEGNRSALLAGDPVLVCKVGRTTGYTEGIVVAVLSSLKVAYAGVARTFRNVYEVVGSGPWPDFALQGDSGALVLTGDRRTLGLLFAGQRGATRRTFVLPFWVVGQVLLSEGGARLLSS